MDIRKVIAANSLDSQCKSRSLLLKSITADESWGFAYDPEMQLTPQHIT
jgi:hypothetical protein